MTLDRDGLRRVLEAFDKGDWDEIRLETGDAVVHLSTSGCPSVTADTSHVSSASPTSASTPASSSAPAPVSAFAAATGAGGSPIPTGTGPAAGLLDVRAPSPGIFWRSPSPGAPPFAEAGARVEADAVLCIVEIMKLMSTVTAPRPGVVAEILVGNGEVVEQGQVIFRLAVDES